MKQTLFFPYPELSGLSVLNTIFGHPLLRFSCANARQQLTDSFIKSCQLSFENVEWSSVETICLGRVIQVSLLRNGSTAAFRARLRKCQHYGNVGLTDAGLLRSILWIVDLMLQLQPLIHQLVHCCFLQCLISSMHNNTTTKYTLFTRKIIV